MILAGDIGGANTRLALAEAKNGQALDLFVSLYGAAAGNLALTTMATAGVYLGQRSRH